MKMCACYVHVSVYAFDVHVCEVHVCVTSIVHTPMRGRAVCWQSVGKPPEHEQQQGFVLLSV